MVVKYVLCVWTYIPNEYIKAVYRYAKNLMNITSCSESAVSVQRSEIFCVYNSTIMRRAAVPACDRY